MESKTILQDKKAPNRLLMVIISLVMVITTLGIVFINKKSEETLRANTISRYENFEKEELASVVATFNQLKDSLVKTNTKDINALYERMLKARASYTRIGEDGSSILLDQNYQYLYKNNNLDSASKSTDFIDLANNPDKYGLNYSQGGFDLCYSNMLKGKQEGRCVVTNGTDVERYYWHMIPSLGSTVNGKVYYMMLGFKEKDALINYTPIHTVNQISLAIQSTLLVVSLFISMWAITTLNFYHKKIIK